LEGLHVIRAIEQEEIADLVEVDLGAGTFSEALERLESAQADRDVERIGELRANAACSTAGRPARELVALEEADVGAGLREVERDARPDHAAPDDDDVGRARRGGHRRMRFFRKNPRFAGRSARRRIRYGYQSGPNGDATSTLYPSAATERWSPGRTP